MLKKNKKSYYWNKQKRFYKKHKLIKYGNFQEVKEKTKLKKAKEKRNLSLLLRNYRIT